MSAAPLTDNDFGHLLISAGFRLSQFSQQLLANLRPRLSFMWSGVVFGQTLIEDVAVPIGDRHL